MVFPGVAINGCTFHLSKNVYKAITEVPGGQTIYHDEDEVSVAVRCLPALAFLEGEEKVQKGE